MDKSTTSLTDHARRNLEMWNAASNQYEERHAQALSGENALAWGLWRIPETELQVLGEVADRDILEYGCGAARWSIGLAQQGARMVGLDFSSSQLAHARRLMAEAGVTFPLIEASAESVPLPAASFDMVFCDWGAMTFCDPYRTVPEVARLLRPGGLFAFANASPLYTVCQSVEPEQLETRLVHDYFGMRRTEWPDEVDFNLPYGEWIKLFKQNGLQVEDLIENRPPVEVKSSYRSEAESEWARHWSMEVIWRVRKQSSKN